jgi:hypothetical protein
MRVQLEIVGGPNAGKQIGLRPGQVAQVGRAAWADLALPGDWSISPLHFALECGYDACRLRDLHSEAGTLLNGVRVTEAPVRPGDQIVAGQNTFALRLADPGQAPAPEAPAAQPARGPAVPSPRPEQERPGKPHDLVAFLRAQPEPLFAVLDAARGFAVVELLQGCPEEHQSLYEGPEGEELADFAPYLVRLPAQSPFLEPLVQQGWGKSWGIYLTSPQSFADVRKHFRRLHRVILPGGETAYFRFYDPRVLRVFLPTCTREEAEQLFGPITGYLLEGKQPGTLLHFSGPSPGRSPVPQAIAVAV